VWEGAVGVWSFWVGYKVIDGRVHKQEQRDEAASVGGLPKREVLLVARREGGLGIQVVEGGDTALKFSHSPLTACKFLHEKFCNNSAAP
jgi:hypothetical protein